MITAEAAGGVSILEALRVSASIAKHTDDSRHLARRGHGNNKLSATLASPPGSSSASVQGLTNPAKSVNGDGVVGGGTASGGFGGAGEGLVTAGGDLKASTPGGGGRRRPKNLSVVPEEDLTSSGSPTGLEGAAAATASLPVVDEEREGAQKDRAPRQQ